MASAKLKARMEKARCEDCIFYVTCEDAGLKRKHFEPGLGICHRYPPAPSSGGELPLQADVFPMTAGEMWCGEFQPR